MVGRLRIAETPSHCSSIWRSRSSWLPVRFLPSQSTSASSIARRSAITAAPVLSAQGLGAAGELIDGVVSPQDLGLVEMELGLHVRAREQEQGSRADALPAVGKRPFSGDAGARARAPPPRPGTRAPDAGSSFAHRDAWPGSLRIARYRPSGRPRGDRPQAAIRIAPPPGSGPAVG